MKATFEGKTVLITGPTSGIGYALTRKIAAFGTRLILVSRNLKSLEKLQQELKRDFSADASAFAVDLSWVGAAEQLISTLKTSEIKVDIFINNAGYGVYGNFSEQALAPQLGMIELHITNPTKLTHAFLPHMNEAGGGILTIGSTGAFQPVASENIYCATKAYVLHFFEALAEENRGKAAVITCFCPGPTRTNFFDAEFMRHRGPAKRVRMDVDRVAEEALKAFSRKKVLEIPGLSNKVLAAGVRFAPRSVVRKAARKIVESIDKGALD